MNNKFLIALTPLLGEKKKVNYGLCKETLSLN